MLFPVKCSSFFFQSRNYRMSRKRREIETSCKLSYLTNSSSCMLHCAKTIKWSKLKFSWTGTRRLQELYFKWQWKVVSSQPESLGSRRKRLGILCFSENYINKGGKECVCTVLKLQITLASHAKRTHDHRAVFEFVIIRSRYLGQAPFNIME